MRPTTILGRATSSRDPESPGLGRWWWCELFCMDKGYEGLDGPRSARICPSSECDYTRVVLFFGRRKEGFTNDFARLANLALLGVQGMPVLSGFSAPTAGPQSAAHVQLTLLVLIRSGGLVIRHPFIPFFLFTPTGSEAMNHTWSCAALNRVHFTPERHS